MLNILQLLPTLKESSPVLSSYKLQFLPNSPTTSAISPMKTPHPVYSQTSAVPTHLLCLHASAPFAWNALPSIFVHLVLSYSPNLSCNVHPL